MAPEFRILAVTDDDGGVREPDWLAAAIPVHRQLRPALPESAAGYSERLERVFASGGRLVVAVSGGAVAGVALWRLLENTYEGRRLYVDDLVVDDARRSHGVGKLLLDWLQEHARRLQCDAFALDSGVQRSRAHQFYFREGMHIASFCFRKALK